MRALVLGAILVVAWPVVLLRFGNGDVYVPIGALALLVIAVVLVASRGASSKLFPRTVREWRRDIAIGVICGALMTGGTYALYAISERWIPALAESVHGLYSNAGTANAGTASLTLALAATTMAIVAEELLWRGPLLRLLERRTSRAIAIAISLGTYTLAQGGSGSGILMLAAFMCGAIWLTERLWTRSVVAPLLSHLMWTLIVVHLLPVTRF